MNTDKTTTDAKFTLIFYRPNGERYEGCGEYVRFDSEMEMSRDLTREDLLAKLVEKMKHSMDCCDSCPQSENENEFAILSADGRPLAARGDSFYSFQPDEETEETASANLLFDEARELIAAETQAKAEAERKAKEVAALKAAEAKKAADDAARVAAEAAERKRFDELKAKFEPKELATQAVEKAQAQATKLVEEAVA